MRECTFFCELEDDTVFVLPETLIGSVRLSTEFSLRFAVRGAGNSDNHTPPKNILTIFDSSDGSQLLTVDVTWEGFTYIKYGNEDPVIRELLPEAFVDSWTWMMITVSNEDLIVHSSHLSDWTAFSVQEVVNTMGMVYNVYASRPNGDSAEGQISHIQFSGERSNEHIVTKLDVLIAVVCTVLRPLLCPHRL